MERMKQRAEKPNDCSLQNKISWLILSNPLTKSIYIISVWTLHSKDCNIILLTKARLLHVVACVVTPPFSRGLLNIFYQDNDAL